MTDSADRESQRWVVWYENDEVDPFEVEAPTYSEAATEAEQKALVSQRITAIIPEELS